MAGDLYMYNALYYLYAVRTTGINNIYVLLTVAHWNTWEIMPSLQHREWIVYCNPNITKFCIFERKNIQLS